MKKFEEPKLEVEKLSLEDVIVTSNDCACDGFNSECPWEG